MIRLSWPAALVCCKFPRRAMTYWILIRVPGCNSSGTNQMSMNDSRHWPPMLSERSRETKSRMPRLSSRWCTLRRFSRRTTFGTCSRSSTRGLSTPPCWTFINSKDSLD
ncbi:MAG: hypothetical protein J3Q66DRAFT_322414, partial [Benniella sp.]